MNDAPLAIDTSLSEMDYTHTHTQSFVLLCHKLIPREEKQRPVFVVREPDSLTSACCGFD